MFLYLQNPIKVIKILNEEGFKDWDRLEKLLDSTVKYNWRNSFGIFREHILSDSTPDWVESGYHHKQWVGILENKLWQDKSVWNSDRLLGIDYTPESLSLAPVGHINRRIVVEAPRDSAKSTLFTVHYPLWKLHLNPNLRIVIVSSVSSQSKSFLREIKGHLELNEKMIDMCGKIVPECAELWTQGEIIVSRSARYKDPSICAVGAGGAILSKRCDILICDDILGLENTRTEDQRIKVKDWFNKILLPILVPNGQLIFVGTIFHPEDLIEEMMRDDSNDVRVRYKSILDYDTHEVLWKERMPYDVLMRKKNSPSYGTVAFNMMYQNEIYDDETSLIKYSWVKEAKRLGSKYKLWNKWIEAKNPFDKVIIVGGVDLAISQSITADYFAFVTLAVELSSGKRIVLDVVRERLTPSQQRKLIVDKFEKFNHSVIMVESNAYQAALVKDMQEYTSIPIKSFITSKEKFDLEVGINSIAVLLENKKFVIPSDFSDARTKNNVSYLCDGLVTYRPDKHTEDTVMALWFANTAGRKLEMMFSKEEYEVESNLFNLEKT